MTAMTKKEFLKRMSGVASRCKCAYGPIAYKIIFDLACYTITEALAEGRSVCLPGIGTLKPVTLPPLERFCALTGEVESAPARRSVKFRPSMMVKRELNKEAKK